MPHDVLKIGERITVVPVIHGSGDFALAVREIMLAEKFDCVAVPLPQSFRAHVEQGVSYLPSPSVVTQPEPMLYASEWSPEKDLRDEDEADGEIVGEDEPTHSYVPIDPCQPVIAAIRLAMEEHIPRAYIDLETAHFRPVSNYLPDAYALKKVALEKFAAAMLPSLHRPPDGQPRERCLAMGYRLKKLEKHYKSILFVCSVLDWPWIRDAFVGQVSRPASESGVGFQPADTGEESTDWQAASLPHEPEDDLVEETQLYAPDPQTLLFLFGELPFITGLYERARSELEDDANLSIDGVKELLIAARTSYLDEFKGRARRITPHLLKVTLRYIRNLSLIERRMTPDLYTIVTAAKQVLGDQYARHVAEVAREYRASGVGFHPANVGEESADWQAGSLPHVRLGINQARLPDGEVVQMISRLPGPPIEWRSLELKRNPQKPERDKWEMQWNPYSQCSYPPEDDLIENFRTHVAQRALEIMGADLVRTEKFTTSVMDGIDIRDTLRNWHTGDIYVKVLPPARGTLDCVIMLFDTPSDPRDYTWRTTWYAEHEEESTLCFFASDFTKEMIGPGIALSNYGGALFLFPPVQIPDIWTDPRFDFAETLEDRLVAAGCHWSRSRHVAILSALPPGAAWRRLAKRSGKRLVHVPLGQFSDSTIQQLRMVHVLNGKTVRSWAAHFIRKA